MLTFERVLEVFQDYLSKDTMYEIVTTSRGCTVLEWDSESNDWSDAKLCATPQDLAEALLDGLASYLEYQMTKCNRECTEQNREQIAAQLKAMTDRLS